MKKFNDLSVSGNKIADFFHNLLRERGINFASGVPCGVIRHVIHNIENDEGILHVPANRESEAVGIVTGAYLAGKIPVLYMQNSGFFASSNDIASLLIPYKIPILMLVSYRGSESEDAPQHFATGKATEALISSLGLDYLIFGEQALKLLINQAFESMSLKKLPFVILFKRGWQNE